MWDLTNREYRRAAPAYAKVVSNTAVEAAEEDKSPDFSVEKPQVVVEPQGPPMVFNQKEWEDKIRKYSAVFRKYPEMYTSSVTVQLEQATSYLCRAKAARLRRLAR